jgi:hypothetical protein
MEFPSLAQLINYDADRTLGFITNRSKESVESIMQAISNDMAPQIERLVGQMFYPQTKEEMMNPAMVDVLDCEAMDRIVELIDGALRDYEILLKGHLFVGLMDAVIALVLATYQDRFTQHCLEKGFTSSDIINAKINRAHDN